MNRCICCLKRKKEVPDVGYCRNCIKAGMKEVADDYIKRLGSRSP